MLTYKYTACWGNIQKTLVLLMTLLLSWPSETVGSCTKFASNQNLETSVEIGGICFYAINGTYVYAKAEILCSSENTRLPHYEDEAKQAAVSNAVGHFWRNHWMGLKNVEGSWQWWDPITEKGTIMTSPRWRDGSEGEGEVATTINDDSLNRWDAKLSLNSCLVICEDVPDVAETGVTMGLFKKTDSISNVEITAEMIVLSELDCAMRCLGSTSCCSFSFSMDKKSCRHFRFVEKDFDARCTSTESCFTLQ